MAAQIEAHLIRRGFKKGYPCWTSQSEEQIIQKGSNNDIVDEVNDIPSDDVYCAFDEDRWHDDNLDQMLRDAEENYNESFVNSRV